MIIYETGMPPLEDMLYDDVPLPEGSYVPQVKYPVDTTMPEHIVNEDYTILAYKLSIVMRVGSLTAENVLYYRCCPAEIMHVSDTRVPGVLSEILNKVSIRHRFMKDCEEKMDELLAERGI